MTNAESSNHEIETAYHEAGHAVVGCLLGRIPLFVTIVRDGPAAGKTEFDSGVPSFARGHFNQSAERRRYARQRILGELAGSIAHDLLKPGRKQDLADEVDLHFAAELTIELVSWQDRDEYLEQAKSETRRLLQDNWNLVDAVAKPCYATKLFHVSNYWL
jgi:hypothetical protein